MQVKVLSLLQEQLFSGLEMASRLSKNQQTLKLLPEPLKTTEALSSFQL